MGYCYLSFKNNDTSEKKDVSSPCEEDSSKSDEPQIGGSKEYETKINDMLHLQSCQSAVDFSDVKNVDMVM